MNFKELHTLLDYHYWALKRVLDAADALSAEQFTKDLGNSFPSIRDTLVHVYSADWIWCSRWEGESPTAMFDPSTFPDVRSLREAWGAHEVRMRSVLDRLGDDGVGRVVTYKTMKGEPQAQPFWQILQHVVNHGSYHRGQITTMMRQLGVKPPQGMDLIAFYRERRAPIA
jgi:uncharacterized damage-inducible protein DinB